MYFTSLLEVMLMSSLVGYILNYTKIFYSEKIVLDTV